MQKGSARITLRDSRWLGGVLILAGLFLLWLSLASSWRWGWEPPYRYVWGANVPEGNENEEGKGINMVAGGGLNPQEGWVIQGSKRLARFLAAKDGDKVALLRWEPTVDEPFIRVYPTLSELLDLASILKKHGAGKRILAWWDISLALSLLSKGLDFAFAIPVHEPLLLPPRWSKKKALEVERAFWQGVAGEQERQRFRAFAEALVADPVSGKQTLCRVAGGIPFVLVLHIRDVISLGALFPGKLGVAFKDFQNMGDMHGAIDSVSLWLRENHYAAYSVMRLEKEDFYRAVALMDKASVKTLSTSLLPFIGPFSSPLEATGEELALVYQTGGFWVYEGKGGC